MNASPGARASVSSAREGVLAVGPKVRRAASLLVARRQELETQRQPFDAAALEQLNCSLRVGQMPENAASRPLGSVGAVVFEPDFHDFPDRRKQFLQVFFQDAVVEIADAHHGCGFARSAPALSEGRRTATVAAPGRPPAAVTVGVGRRVGRKSAAARKRSMRSAVFPVLVAPAPGREAATSSSKR